MAILMIANLAFVYGSTFAVRRNSVKRKHCARAAISGAWSALQKETRAKVVVESQPSVQLN